jgi:hypothetical protein
VRFLSCGTQRLDGLTVTLKENVDVMTMAAGTHAIRSPTNGRIMSAARCYHLASLGGTRRAWREIGAHSLQKHSTFYSKSS